MSHVPHKLAHCRTTAELHRQASYYRLRTQDALRRSVSDAIEFDRFLKCTGVTLRYLRRARPLYDGHQSKSGLLGKRQVNNAYRTVGCACLGDKYDRGIRIPFSVIFRQRNKFRFVARNACKMALTPIVLGCGNAIFRTRHEVPPNMTRPFHRLSAEQHQPRVRFSKDRNAIAGLENEKLAGIKRLPRDIDAARCDIRRRARRSRDRAAEPRPGPAPPRHKSNRAGRRPATSCRKAIQ